jgi:hypothetical protein
VSLADIIAAPHLDLHILSEAVQERRALDTHSSKKTVFAEQKRRNKHFAFVCLFDRLAQQKEPSSRAAPIGPSAVSRCCLSLLSISVSFSPFEPIFFFFAVQT